MYGFARLLRFSPNAANFTPMRLLTHLPVSPALQPANVLLNNASSEAPQVKLTVSVVAGD